MSHSIPSKIQVIGRNELVSFPQLGLYDLVAKIDTGAYSTAIHCYKASVSKNLNGLEILEVQLEQDSAVIRFESFSQRKVKSSNGKVSSRFTLRTSIVVGAKRIKGSISFADRSDMRFTVLIGRKILKKRFWVDVSREFLLASKSSTDTKID